MRGPPAGGAPVRKPAPAGPPRAEIGAPPSGMARQYSTGMSEITPHLNPSALQ